MSSCEASRPDRRLFLGLSIFSLMMLLLVVRLLWWFVAPRLISLNTGLALGIQIVLTAACLLVGFGAILIVLTSYTERNFLYFGRIVQLSVRVLFPLTVRLGRVIGISKDRIRESFVAVNNSMVRARHIRVRPQEVLVLLPHCLQRQDCRIRVTTDITFCAECGRCDLAALLQLSRKYGVSMAIATGGTLARKLIMERRPKFVLAVACHRDLVDGIKDVFPIPSYGVLNLRPEGPCINTRVVVSELEQVLRSILLNSEDALSTSQN